MCKIDISFYRGYANYFQIIASMEFIMLKMLLGFVSVDVSGADSRSLKALVLPNLQKCVFLVVIWWENVVRMCAIQSIEGLRNLIFLLLAIYVLDMEWYAQTRYSLRGICYRVQAYPWCKEILHNWDVRNPVNNGMFTISTGDHRISSINSINISWISSYSSTYSAEAL